MHNLLKNQMFRNVVSTLMFGVFYVLLTFLIEGAVDWGTIGISVITYFLMMCLLSFLSPKLRKILGYDKED
ncbi:MAG: hypothetical protein J6K04_08895 [Lachnospiraceae bacterium]|nr:hypothetical protein [Lachnospiraceae bacterium]